MLANLELPAISELFIDGNDTDRAFYAEGLKSCWPGYRILEATNGHSGRSIYRSQRVDCVVLEIVLPDRSGLEILVDLVPIARRPHIAVVVLTRLKHRPVWEGAKQLGAYAVV